MCLPCATYGNQRDYRLHRRPPSNVWATIEPPLCLLCAASVPSSATNGDHWATIQSCFCLLGDPWALFGRPLATAGQPVWFSCFNILPDWRENLQQNASITWRPLVDHCASILQPRQCLCLCLLWATFEQPTSSATFVRLFWTCSKIYGDHGVHGDVWTSCVPPSNDLCNHSASFEPPTATWQILWSHKRGTKVAILCKGGIRGVGTNDAKVVVDSSSVQSDDGET